MDYKLTAQWILKQINATPDVGIVLGTGLSGLVDMLDDKIVIPYKDVPGFVKSTAPSHAGNIVFGYLSGKAVLLYQGRFHFYEGYTMNQVVFPIRVLAAMNVKNLIVTNASGSLREDFKPGDIVVITDHINFMGTNPLIGENLDDLGERFPSMNMQYSIAMHDCIRKVAADRGVALQWGTYIAVTGPSLETKAECAMFAKMGADVVGMSTVPEVIVARHSGINVLGISVVTNYSNLFHDLAHSQEEIRANADKASANLKLLITEVLEYV
jgi:purine-nucleoside phosphorylase